MQPTNELDEWRATRSKGRTTYVLHTIERFVLVATGIVAVRALMGLASWTDSALVFGLWLFAGVIVGLVRWQRNERRLGGVGRENS
jgi:type IV secretory pathway TrbD component